MLAGRTVLTVDPVGRRRTELVHRLRRSGVLSTAEASDAVGAIGILSRSQIDAMLIRGALVDMDALLLCRLLRRDGFAGPVIVLSDTAEDAEIVLSLDAGANDHVRTPVDTGVLLARLRAHLRSSDAVETALLPIGSYLLDIDGRTLLDRETGGRVRLTGAQSRLLKLLYRTEGEAVPRERLLAEVLGYSPGADTHTLATHLWRLRRKIERDPAAPAIVITEKDGYRLAPPARFIRRDSRSASI